MSQINQVNDKLRLTGANFMLSVRALEWSKIVFMDCNCPPRRACRHIKVICLNFKARLALLIKGLSNFTHWTCTFLSLLRKKKQEHKVSYRCSLPSTMENRS